MHPGKLAWNPKNGGLVRIISFSLGVGEPAGLISQCVGIIRDQGTNPCCPLFNVREVDPNKMAWPREGRDVWRECITNRPYEFIKGIFMGMGLLPMKLLSCGSWRCQWFNGNSPLRNAGMHMWAVILSPRLVGLYIGDEIRPSSIGIINWAIGSGSRNQAPPSMDFFFMDFFVQVLPIVFFGVEIMKII